MITELYTLIGIIDDTAAKGTINLDEFNQNKSKNNISILLDDFLQVPRYYPIVLKILNEKHNLTITKKKIDIQLIFQALDDGEITAAIPDYYRNRMSIWMIKLIKCAIIIYSNNWLNFQEIREASNIHQLKETELLTIGVPCESNTINSMLWAINRTITLPILNKWIKMVWETLEVKGNLMAHEFLFLVCNTHSKKECIEKVPKLKLSSKFDPEFRIFKIDDEFLKSQAHIASSDTRILHMLNSIYSPEKVRFEGKVHQNGTKDKFQKKKNTALNVNNTLETHQMEYIKLLKSPELLNEIKERLKCSQININCAKNSLPDHYVSFNTLFLKSESSEFKYQKQIMSQNQLGNTINNSQPVSPKNHFKNGVDIVRKNPCYLACPKIRPRSSLPGKTLIEIKKSLGIIGQRPESANNTILRGDLQFIERNKLLLSRKSSVKKNMLLSETYTEKTKQYLSHDINPERLTILNERNISSATYEAHLSKDLSDVKHKTQNIKIARRRAKSTCINLRSEDKLQGSSRLYSMA